MSTRPSAPNGAPVLRTAADGVVTVTLNRPERFNALDGATLDELRAALLSIATDPGARVVIIAGAGPAFCAGHDLKEMLANCDETFIGDLFGRCAGVMRVIRDLPQPVIARVQGIATAAGCQLVAACDLAVASADARFATSGINLGLFCATPAVPVSRNVARKRAFEMLFTGEFIDAATALDWGLVNRVVAAADLDAEAGRLAMTLLQKPREVVAAGKRLFYEQVERPLDEAYALATACISRNMLGDAAQEGVRAFVEKRRPRWLE
jgi:enoyl-CoA hydratase/carnithine racemase